MCHQRRACVAETPVQSTPGCNLRRESHSADTPPWLLTVDPRRNMSSSAASRAASREKGLGAGLLPPWSDRWSVLRCLHGWYRGLLQATCVKDTWHRHEARARSVDTCSRGCIKDADNGLSAVTGGNSVPPMRSAIGRLRRAGTASDAAASANG